MLIKSLVVLLQALSVLAIPLQTRGSEIIDKIQSRGGNVPWDYETQKVNGVNLGGWFVLEAYITPSLFQAFPASSIPVDEYHYTKQLGKQLAGSRLNAHWSSWYTEKDFEQMESVGLNFVRIPIGYWAFALLDDDPYVQGQVAYLDQALEWSRKYNLKVWIDLHGAPGSQNGFDNSGLRDTLQWQNGNNQQFTLDVLQTIFEKYGGPDYSDIVAGIELINEPLGPALDVNKIKLFYESAYTNLRNTGSVTPVIFHDAFEQSDGYWDDFFNVQDGYWNVVLDHHHYQVFSASQLEMDINDHISTACGWGESAKHDNKYNVAGEWSAALTDCAVWLNGVGRGARWSGDYDNSPDFGSCAPYTSTNSWTKQHAQDVRRYVEAQLDAYELTGGWIFWNWKTEDAVDWDLQRLINVGAFPQPFNSRQYPNQCGF